MIFSPTFFLMSELSPSLGLVFNLYRLTVKNSIPNEALLRCTLMHRYQLKDNIISLTSLDLMRRALWWYIYHA